MDFNPPVDKGQCSKGLYSWAPHQSVNPLIAVAEWGDNKAPFVVFFYGSVCVRPRVCGPIIQGVSIRGPLDQWAAWPLHCAAGLARDVMPSIRCSTKGVKEKQGKVPHLPPTELQKRQHERHHLQMYPPETAFIPPKHTFTDYGAFIKVCRCSEWDACWLNDVRYNDRCRLLLNHCLSVCLLMLTKVLLADSDEPYHFWSVVLHWSIAIEIKHGAAETLSQEKREAPSLFPAERSSL